MEEVFFLLERKKSRDRRNFGPKAQIGPKLTRMGHGGLISPPQSTMLTTGERTSSLLLIIIIHLLSNILLAIRIFYYV